MKKSYIVVRTQFEGYHCYPNAGDIDPRIKFLENVHRHLFHVEVKISVTDLDRELEFFVVKWALQDFISEMDLNTLSCESIANIVIDKHLLPMYGYDRYYNVVISEDGESDGIVEYFPKKQ